MYGCALLDEESATPLSGAELFMAGRFSEALSEFDTAAVECRQELSNQSCTGILPLPRSSSSLAVYAACNRAAAKLELEMCRSCLRDCDEAIKMDPFCLRGHFIKGYRPFEACM